MQRIVVLLIAAFFLGMGCPVGQAAGQKTPHTSWVFETRVDKDTTPHSRVSLLIGGRRVLIARDLTGQFTVMPPRDYKEHGVPADAVTACSGWWAGQGQDFYVIRLHGHWEVFRRDLDEEAPTSNYRRVHLADGVPEGDRARRRKDHPRRDTRL